MTDPARLHPLRSAIYDAAYIKAEKAAEEMRKPTRSIDPGRDRERGRSKSRFRRGREKGLEGELHSPGNRIAAKSLGEQPRRNPPLRRRKTLSNSSNEALERKS